jgi:hypothetical protein
VVRDDCLKSEQTLRNQLNKAWHEVPPDIQAQCIRQGAEDEYGSYEVLHFCVLREIGYRWINEVRGTAPRASANTKPFPAYQDFCHDADDGCPEREQVSRKYLENAWSVIEPATQARCMEWSAQDKGGSYGVLLTCVVLEVGAKWIDSGGRYP